MKKALVVAVIGIVLLCGACTSATKGASASKTTPAPAPRTTSAPASSKPSAPAPKATVPPVPKATTGELNAEADAQQYLSLGTGFSQTGLIQQLSGPGGDGYSVADATWGVTALHVNWDAQAVLDAKNYLSIEPFSYSGLIQQLSGAGGDGFTYAQAVYGVHGAGLTP